MDEFILGCDRATDMLWELLVPMFRLERALLWLATDPVSFYNVYTNIVQ